VTFPPTTRRFAFLVVALLAMGVCNAPLAASDRSEPADIQACTVLTVLPATISTPGIYCLDRDFEQGFTSAAVLIQADDVVFDCNGHTLRATNPGNASGGVNVGNNKRVTVRHCTIDNFAIGIDMAGSGHRVEDNTILRGKIYALHAIGSNIRIERNHISQLRADYINGNGFAAGIYFLGAFPDSTGNVIRDNVITDFKVDMPPGNPSTVTVSAIYLTRDKDARIVGNTIGGIYSDYRVWAIRLENVQNVLVADNTVLSPPPLPAPFDGAQAAGIFFWSQSAGAPNLCVGNTVGHFTTDIQATACTKVDNAEF
jgi:hypothetical protein